MAGHGEDEGQERASSQHAGGKNAPAKNGREANSLRDGRTQKEKEKPYRKKNQSVPQKNEPVPQKMRYQPADDLVDDEDLEDDGFVDFAGNANWRVERRFYTKKDGTIMLYWNYRSRTPVYISDGTRKIKYKPGGKKVWQPSKKKSKK